MADIESGELLLAKARREGNQHMIAVYLGALGLMYADERGDYHRGIQYLEEAKQISEQIREWDNAAAICNNLAGCYEVGLNDLPTATKYMEMAASITNADNPQKKIYQARSANMRQGSNKR